MEITAKKATSATKLIIGIILFMASVYFIWLNRKFYSFTPEAFGKYIDVKWIIIGHIAGGAVALLAGPPLLWARVRNNYLKLHRAMGKAYLIAILIAGSCAIYLCATTAKVVGWPYVFSLYVLAALWMTAAVLSYYFVRKRKIKLHEEWTKRSYILTVAFIAQNFLMYNPVIVGLGTFAETSPTVIWVSWSVPLFLFNIYLSFKQTGKR